MNIGGKKLSLSISEIDEFRKAMLKNPRMPGYERWKNHSNTSHESFLGAYAKKISSTIETARADKKRTEVELSSLNANKQQQDVRRAELEVKISRVQKNIDKDIEAMQAIEAECASMIKNASRILKESFDIREEIKNNTFLARKGQSSLNTFWQEFAKDLDDVPDEFREVLLSGEDSPQLTEVFLLGHPAYRLLFDVQEVLKDYDEISPVRAMPRLAEEFGYKMPDFSQVKTLADMDPGFLKDNLEIYTRFQNAKGEFKGSFKKMDAKIAKAKKYLDGKSRAYEIYQNHAKNGRIKKLKMLEGLDIKDYETMMELELKYSGKAHALAAEMNAQSKRTYNISVEYSKTVLDIVERMLTKEELEKELAGLPVDASYVAKHEKLVTKLAIQQSRLEDLENTRCKAQGELKKELDRLAAKETSRKSRRTSEENLHAYFEKIEAGEKPGGRDPKFVFEGKHNGENDLLPEARQISGEAMENFINVISGEFPVIEKSYTKYTGQFRETMETLALAYAENGFRLSLKALFMAFPGKVKVESTYKKFPYKPVRIAIESSAMLRLLVDMTDNEKPVIFFVGSKSESEKIMPRDSLKQAIESAKNNPNLAGLFETLKQPEKERQFSAK